MTGFFHRLSSLAPKQIQAAHPEVRRFIKFAIVGLFGAVIDFGLLITLVRVVHVQDNLANIFSVSAAIISNFIWNTVWTFPESRAQTLHKHFVKFAVVNLIGLGINEAVFVTTKDYFFNALFHENGFLVAKFVAVGVVLFWNFGINRIWTYRHIKWGEAPEATAEEWSDASAL